MWQYFSHLEVLLSYLGIRRITLIGTSMGGVLGMMLAAKVVTSLHRLILNYVSAVIPRKPMKHICAQVGAEPHFTSVEEVAAHMRAIYAGAGPHEVAQWWALAEISGNREEDGSYALAFDPGIARPMCWM